MDGLLTSVAKILQIGFSGLAFLLAYLAYCIIARAQQTPKPQAQILAAASKFMWFSLSLGVLTGIAQLGEVGLKTWLSTREVVVKGEDKLDANAVQQAFTGLRESVGNLNRRVDGIRLTVTGTSTSPEFACGGQHAAEPNTLTVMYGSKDGTSCGVHNINYYKQLAIEVPK